MNATSFPTTGANGPSSRRTRFSRFAMLSAVAATLSACDSVAMREPLTGAVETCQDGMRGLTPWSQTEACVADREALGWTRLSQD